MTDWGQQAGQTTKSIINAMEAVMSWHNKHGRLLENRTGGRPGKLKGQTVHQYDSIPKKLSNRKIRQKLRKKKRTPIAAPFRAGSPLRHSLRNLFPEGSLEEEKEDAA